jgi:DNA-binding GntR family transcriptional regulator
MKTKKEKTTSNMIADSLRDAINFGTLKPSDKLIEQKLAEKYQSSHIPVREALSILEGEGLIVHRKFAGCMVREVNPDEMIELFNIMRFLTVHILTRAIPRYTEMTYYQLKSILMEMEKTKDPHKNIDLVMEFADGIFFPAGLTFSYNLVKQLLKRNIPVFQGVIRSESNGTLPVSAFNQFINLCEKHDVENAIKFTKDQLDVLTKTIVAFVSSSRGSERKE